MPDHAELIMPEVLHHLHPIKRHRTFRIGMIATALGTARIAVASRSQSFQDVVFRDPKTLIGNAERSSKPRTAEIQTVNHQTASKRTPDSNR